MARIKPGQKFLFAGKSLELVGFKDLTARVKVVSGKTTAVSRWMGSKMPLSTLLADGVRERLDEARRGIFLDAEMRAVSEILVKQQEFSCLPEPDELLIEQMKSREGFHCFVFTFAGRLVHEGLASLVAWRMSKDAPCSISLMCNDYGFELLAPQEIHRDEAGWRRLLAADGLVEDLLACLNETELARRQFREVARVAGLIVEGFPGARKSTRQLQASSGLLFDVFARFDPQNMLMAQARREVLERQLEVSRLQFTLARTARERLTIVTPERLTPLAFPLWAERIREQVSSESWLEKVQGMIARLEK